MKKTRRLKLIFLISIIAAVLAAGFIGYLVGNKSLVLSENHIPKLVKKDLGRPKDVDFELFWQAYQKLRENYFGKIDPQKFLYGSIAGSYASLDDPYTIFLPPEASSDFQKELSGELEGIGVKIGVYEGYPAVIAPLENSPAKKAGLKPKDQIIKIDDLDAKSLPLDEAVLKIRGKEGTSVKLTIKRANEDRERVLEIKREKIEVKTVEVKYKDDVAIIELNEFGLGTKDDFVKIAKEVADKGTGKVILDLRNNPGGVLDGAVDVAGEFFPKDTVIVIEDSKAGKLEMKTSGGESLKNVNLVVLVNGGSASAAEILAGAVKDHQRGKVIGEKTFGKGTVQQFENLPDSSSVKITVARWLTPEGLSIDKDGITPDIEVKEPDSILFDDEDPLIKRALEEVKK